MSIIKLLLIDNYKKHYLNIDNNKITYKIILNNIIH